MKKPFRLKTKDRKLMRHKEIREWLTSCEDIFISEMRKEFMDLTVAIWSAFRPVDFTDGFHPGPDDW